MNRAYAIEKLQQNSSITPPIFIITIIPFIHIFSTSVVGNTNTATIPTVIAHASTLLLDFTSMYYLVENIDIWC